MSFGPWIVGQGNGEFVKNYEFTPGMVVEVEVTDPKRTVTTAIIVIEKKGAKRSMVAHFVAGANKCISDWFDKEEGHPNPGLYKFWAERGDEKDKKINGVPCIVVTKWRKLFGDGDPVNLAPLNWVKEKSNARITGTILDLMQGMASSPNGGPTTEAAGTKSVLLPGASRCRQTRVEADLADLRKSVERDPRGAIHEANQKGSDNNAKRSRSPRRSHHRRDGQHRSRRTSPHHRPRSPERARPVPPTPLGPDDRGRDRSASGRRRTPSPFRSEVAQPKPISSFGQDPKHFDEQDKERSKEKDRKRRRHRSPSRSRSASSESVFQVASSSKGRSSQARLIQWAHSHPGRLAAAGLQKMENRVGRDGEAGAWDPHSTPASAKSYYLRVLKLDPHHSRRNLREMHTLAAALDHLALGRNRQASDLLMQRLKALELASSSGSWERASFLELLETEDATLVGTEESFLVAKETELAQKLQRQGFQSGWGQNWQSWQSGWASAGGKSSPWNQDQPAPSQKGGKSKGKGKGGKKGKGVKGKGKGKGEKDDQNLY